MRYLLAPTAAAIVVLGACASMQKDPTHPKAALVGCRPSGADILLKDEVAKRDVYLCFNSDGSLYWQVGPQKPVAGISEPLAPIKKSAGKTKNKENTQK